MIDYKKKKCFLEHLIQWLKDIETSKYRGCHLCVHLGEPSKVISIPRHSDMTILPSCFACDRYHECFELDYEKLAEAVEFGLVTRRKAHQICKKEELRTDLY